MSDTELIKAYGTSYDELRLGTADLAEQLWLELGGPDDVRQAAAGDAIEELVNDANRATFELAENYVDEYVGAVSRQPPPQRSAVDDVVDLGEVAVDQLRGVADSYRRPAVSVRKALADGKPFDQAMREAGNRVNAQAQADVAMAHRLGAQRAMERHDVDLYRRVLTGTSCDLCRVASTQVYRTADLMPIHSRCDCRVAPIVGDYDGGRIANRELYRELKADGTLDRLNRSNRGTTGRSRQARARANRARQRRLDGLEQVDLDLPPLEAPTVRTHGELGPVLVNERHTFAAARRADDVVEGAGDLRRRGPDVNIEAPPTVTAPPKATEAVARSGRWTPETPSVIRAAQRRNVSPETIIDELELKRVDRLAEQRAERELVRQLSDVDSDEIRKLADAYDVTPDEVVANVAKVPNARRVMSDAATRVQLDAFERLDDWGTPKLGRPPRSGRGGEWDWLDALTEPERKRLRRSWFDDPDLYPAPDQAAETMARLEGDLGSDEAMRRWLEQTRRYEAAGGIRRGKLPSEAAYSGRIDLDALLAGYVDDAGELAISPSEVVGRYDGDVAGRLAQLARQADVADAELYLDDAIRARTGDPAPWRMSFQSWEAEVRDLEHALRNDPTAARADAVDRLRELVPEYLDEPGTSFEELYTRTIDAARRADLDVSPSARMPWDGVDLDDALDDLVRQAEADEAAAQLTEEALR